jgi:hypothetical protein
MKIKWFEVHWSSNYEENATYDDFEDKVCR